MGIPKQRKKRTRTTQKQIRDIKPSDLIKNTRKTHKRKTYKNKVHRNNHNSSNPNGSPAIIGLIYANWCGHCQQLKPTWEELKKRITNNYDNQFTIVEIEAEQADKAEQLAKLEKELNGEKINIEGFPTVLKINDGKLNYYGGARYLDSMMNWATGNKPLIGGYQPHIQRLKYSKSKSKSKSQSQSK